MFRILTNRFSLFLLLQAFFFTSAAQSILPGATRIDSYLPLLKGKQVAVYANQTSTVGNEHLVDVLLKNGVAVKRIFGPEHGFRGTADAGQKVANDVDPKTGIPVISLYGAKRLPSDDDMKGIDVIVFDIQDVGVRFYTFISSLEEIMEVAFQHAIPFVLLDRPNPNIHYVDGPVLDRGFKSFVGMQPVPVVYGMTIGEYATMLLGERWLKPEAMNAYQQMKSSGSTPFTVIPCSNYNRSMRYELSVKPSPNLPDNSAIYWYPSMCFFEGTVVSEGRGTPKPFQVVGHPDLPHTLFSFTPVSMPGATQPKLKDQVCYGWNVSGSSDESFVRTAGKIQLSFLLEAYRLFPEKEKFFILPKSGDAAASFFNKLAGNASLMQQIKIGWSEEAIRASWKNGIDAFLKIRSNYLIYQ
ncbi:MAG: exo-beta-N-acetylmuramidase NamZ domain-containing protein [Bacteroidota bacterium]